MSKKITTIKERVLQIAEKKGVSKKPFIESIGMTYGNFTGIKAKSTPLNSDAITNILLSFPEINPDWLLTGNGPMIRETSDKDSRELEDTYTEEEVSKATETGTKELLSDLLMNRVIYLPDAIETRDALIEQLKNENARLLARIESLEKNIK